METLLLFLYIIISVSLVGLILLQQSKGSDIGSAFGGGSSNTMFGPNSSLSPLAKITAILAVIFLVLSFYLTLQSRNQNNEVILGNNDYGKWLGVTEAEDAEETVRKINSKPDLCFYLGQSLAIFLLHYLPFHVLPFFGLALQVFA